MSQQNSPVLELPDFTAMKPQDVKSYLKRELKGLLARREEVLSLCRSDRRKSVQELCEHFQRLEERHQAEVARVRAMYDFDRHYGTLVAGVDEVGRGPLAGPIVGAAVILPGDCLSDELILGINDSKKLSAKQRQELVPLIKEQAVAWALFEHSSQEIDELGLSFCNNNIFVQAVRKLCVQPHIVLSDGYPIRHINLRNEKVIKGDSKSAAIACASILAKVYRDELMISLDKKYPGYGFCGNVGYASREHIESLRAQGPCAIHRRSFLTRILEEEPEQLTLSLE